MLRTATGFLGLLILLSALQAGDKSDTSTPSQQYQALVKEYEATNAEFSKELASLRNREERLKLLLEKNPKDRFALRFLELAERNRMDPAAVDALAWIVSHAVTKKRDPQDPVSKAIQILLRDQLHNDKLATLCQNPSLRSALDDERRHLLRVVLDQSKSRPARGQACFALAHQAETRLRTAQRLKENPEMAKMWEASMGKPAVDALANADLEKLCKEAESLYQRVVQDFGDLADSDGKKLGETAKEKVGALPYPIVVGKPAPDIEGEDIDAKRFKLSDYRGKVVLLDFWGNW